MKLSDKLHYFYNDIFEIIEELQYLDILSEHNTNRILSFISQSFHSNFGAGNNKDYFRLDKTEVLRKLIKSNGYEFREKTSYIPSETIKELEKVKDQIFKELHKQTYIVKEISTDCQLSILDRFGGIVLKDRYLKLL